MSVYLRGWGGGYKMYWRKTIIFSKVIFTYFFDVMLRHNFWIFSETAPSPSVIKCHKKMFFFATPPPPL